MKIAIAICHRQVGYPEMWRHVQPLIHATSQAGHHVVQMASEGLVVGDMRTQLVDEALTIGCDAVAFLDDDHVFPSGSLNRLMSWDVPIVGALYPTRIAPSHRSTAMIAQGSVYRALTVEECASDGLVAVDAIGMGLTVIRRDVFMQCPRPWFRVSHRNGRDIDDGMYFCEIALSSGFPIYVDAGLKIGHLGLVAVSYASDGTVVYRPPFLSNDPVELPEKVVTP